MDAPAVGLADVVRDMAVADGDGAACEQASAVVVAVVVGNRGVGNGDRAVTAQATPAARRWGFSSTTSSSR